MAYCSNMVNLRLCISRLNHDQNNRIILQRDNIYFQNRYEFQLSLNNTRLRLYEEMCISNVVDDANRVRNCLRDNFRKCLAKYKIPNKMQIHFI